MNKAILVFSDSFSVLLWGTAAQDEPIKIGIVDIDQAISSTEEGKAAREEFARKQREAEASCSRCTSATRRWRTSSRPRSSCSPTRRCSRSSSISPRSATRSRTR